MIDNVNLIYFSPTGTSRKIAHSIGDGLKVSTITDLDLTYANNTMAEVSSNSMTVLVSPVYGGRIPNIFFERLGNIEGKGTPCVLVVVYGNRHYDDALLELKNEAVNRGFIPVSAASFIGEHSYSRKDMPIAEGRPDVCDLSMAELFGKESNDKLRSVNEWHDLVVPGNFPYKELKPQQPVAPLSTDECTSCGVCVSLCPTDAIEISSSDKLVTEVTKCIKCCACVKGCPSNARIFETPFTKFLYDNFKDRKLPEFYF